MRVTVILFLTVNFWRLEPRGVKEKGGETAVSVCVDCVTSIRKSKDVPLQYSLANNMWIGNIPWEFQRLTFPEQLLVSCLSSRIHFQAVS